MTDTTEFTPTIDPSNATVQAMFGAVLQQKIQGGALEQALSKYADKLIDDCAQDVLRSYGDVGKAVKEALAKARKEATIKLVTDKFPGVEVKWVVDGEPAKVSFTFPGGTYAAHWTVGEGTIDVANGDTASWEAYREPYRQKEATNG